MTLIPTLTPNNNLLLNDVINNEVIVVLTASYYNDELTLHTTKGTFNLIGNELVGDTIIPLSELVVYEITNFIWRQELRQVRTFTNGETTMTFSTLYPFVTISSQTLTISGKYTTDGKTLNVNGYEVFLDSDEISIHQYGSWVQVSYGFEDQMEDIMDVLLTEYTDKVHAVSKNILISKRGKYMEFFLNDLVYRGTYKYENDTLYLGDKMKASITVTGFDMFINNEYTGTSMLDVNTIIDKL